MAPSRSAFQRSIVGTPRGADFFFGGGFAAGAFFLAAGALDAAFLAGVDIPALKKDPKPALAAGLSLVALTGLDGAFFAGFFGAGLAGDFFGAAFFFGVSSPPSPNREDNETVTPGAALFNAFSASCCLAFFAAAGGGLAGFGI